MITTYKPRCEIQIDVPKSGSRTESIKIRPAVIEVKWSRNNHLVADELTVTVGSFESNISPREVKNARCAFFFWDDNEEFSQEAYLRFTGICISVTRRLGDDGGWVSDLKFHDYTTLFIHNKPLKTSGMPNWSDTLTAVWERICDNTGWEDPSNGKILSSVEALKPRLRFTNPEFASRTLGEMVPKRFHAISKPQPQSGASSWDVWQWCVCSLGLISYIDKDECVVTDTTEHYSRSNAPMAIYGENIHSLEEESDSEMSSKGILLKSMDPLTFRTLESFYPLPGDERLKTKRSAVGKKSEGGTSVTANEVSGDYEEYNRYDITDQAALDRAAREAYEERSRQELQGSFKTAEMTIETVDGEKVDVLSLRAGDAIMVTLRNEDTADTLKLLDSEETRVRYLIELDIDEDIARLIAKNFDADDIKSTLFHVKNIELDYGPDRFEVEIKYHNLINIGS